MSKIRDLRPCEYGLLDSFLYEALFVAPGERQPSRSVLAVPELRAYVSDFGARREDRAVCAEVGGAVVGIAWMRRFKGFGFVDDQTPELAISVLPDHRGKGVGRSLIRALLLRAIDIGAPAISLSVHRANPAMRLYERFGFFEVGGDGIESVMVLPLSHSKAALIDYHGGSSFHHARSAAMRVLTAPGLGGRSYLMGGLVPWVALDRESGRPHGDVDIGIRLDDMHLLRTWLHRDGVYDVSLDSLFLACNHDGIDYGVHAMLEGVLVSFCPFHFSGGALHQRNALLREIDGFEALMEAVVPGLKEEDYVEVRKISHGMSIGCSTLEAIRAEKTLSAREKDAHDISAIDSLILDAERYARVMDAYAGMRVECMAHEGGWGPTGLAEERVSSLRRDPSLLAP
ncbi:MAG: GNAT family N-acetyltransferase [Collinsella sp.]|nr:GNAT family N-acetyltransferase [Collinsella sp.]